jgi:hypothetical protein
MAGFFEGEGSIGLCKHGSSKQVDIQVQMDSGERELLEVFHKEFGGVVVVSHRLHPNYNTWKWRIVSRMALRFAMTLFPYVHGDLTKAKFQRIFDHYHVTPQGKANRTDSLEACWREFWEIVESAPNKDELTKEKSINLGHDK